MANLKKGDIVRMNYNASIIGSDVVFDTTYEDKAKEAGIFNEKYSYAPMPYIVGSGRFFKALDDAIAAAEVGKEVTIEVPCEQAAGEKDPKLIETFSVKDFYKQEIRPVPGLEVRLGDRAGVITTVGSGRVKVDFNDKLAGKDLKYTFTVTEVMESNEDKAMAIAQMDFGSNEGFKFEFSENKVSIYTPDIVKFNQNWMMTKFRIVNDMREAFAVDTIEFIEVWEKAPAAEKKE